jgi:alanine dehydrogenase
MTLVAYETVQKDDGAAAARSDVGGRGQACAASRGESPDPAVGCAGRGARGIRARLVVLGGGWAALSAARVALGPGLMGDPPDGHLDDVPR